MKEVAALAGEDATVADVIKELYAAINADKTGILAKLTGAGRLSNSIGR